MLNRLLIVSVMLLALSSCCLAKGNSMAAGAPVSRSRSFDEDWFLLDAEFIRSSPISPAIKDVAARKMVDTFDFWAPLGDEAMRFIQEGNYGLVLHLPGDPKILSHFNREGVGFPTTAEFIESEVEKLRVLTRQLGRKAWWDLLPEFDSSDHWWVDRPVPSGTRQQAWEQWRDYYLALSPLSRYLRQKPEERGVNLLACCGSDMATHYAYELGVDLALLERNNDHCGDFSTGLCFIRGAARQYDRPWGIDISEWRDASQSPTEYTREGQMIGGWSISYHRRHLLLSYMAGANLLRLEAVAYHNEEGKLNPFGELVQETARFIDTHKDRGRPAVSTALLLDFPHGFDPRHGEWDFSRAEVVWRGGIPFSDGDHMIDNFLQVAFPGHKESGTTPNAPWSSPKQFREMLAQGLDPRPYEPMGTTRWGDNLDVILSNASSRALAQYRTIILLGDVKLAGELKERLLQWVGAGGTLVANIQQISDFGDQQLLGFRLWGGEATAAASRWLGDGTVYDEPGYRYTIVEPSTATVLADSLRGDPLVTRQKVGAGELIVTTPNYLQSEDRHRWLTIGSRLVDALTARHALAEVQGPPVEFMVNQAPGKIIVTLVNSSGQIWHGSVVFTKPDKRYRTVEWFGGTEVEHEEYRDRVSARIVILPYEMKAVALEQAR